MRHDVNEVNLFPFAFALNCGAEPKWKSHLHFSPAHIHSIRTLTFRWVVGGPANPVSRPLRDIEPRIPFSNLNQNRNVQNVDAKWQMGVGTMATVARRRQRQQQQQ